MALDRRRLLQGTGAAAGAAGLALAAGGTGSQIGLGRALAQEAGAAGTLIEGFVGDFGLLAPIVDANRQTLMLFDTLVSQSAETLEPQPNLAERWAISEDGLVYTFTLVQGVTFHDGAPFTSADVKFTLDLLLNEATGSGYHSLFAPRIASVEAPDDATVVVTLTAPSPTLLNDFSAYSIAILPRHVLADVKPEELAASEFATSKPVGTGPFKLVEYRPGEALILEPNAAYHRGAPKLDGYALKVLGDATVAYQQLKTGEVDVTPIQPDFYEDAQAQETFTPVLIDTFSFYFLAYNMDAELGTPALKELPVRQALFQAIDRQLLIDSILSGLGIVAVGTQPPAATWAHQPDKITKTYPYDPAAANALLDDAGWVAGADGVRAKNGERLSFTVLGNTQPATEGMVLALQEFYKAIGVEVTPVLEPESFFDKLLAKEYQLAVVNFTFAPDPDQSLLWSSTSAFNAMGYKNDRVDELLAQGLATADTAERAAHYLEMQNLLLEDLPAAVLIFNQRVTGVNNRVRNYVPSAVGYYWAVAYDAPTWEIVEA